MFDNLDDSHLLEIAPQLGSLGSLILTSRDPMIAFGTVSAAIQTRPFDQSHGAEAIFNFLGKKIVSDVERSLAEDVSKALGGLPLAIAQISGFIAQQKLSLSGFVPFYERNAARINERSISRSQSQHTLSTVWSIAIQTMTAESRRIQSLLAFFDPDRIQEDVLMQGIPHLASDDLDFILNEIELVLPKGAD